MNPSIDITNQRFGKLIAIKKVESKNKKTYWLCQCDCGNECIISTNALRSGHTSSCGCITSKGEEKIAMWLQAHDIKFERQKTFDTCRNTKTNALLRFDFFINNNFLLEYDGISHFKSTGGWNTEEMVQNIQNNDKIKNTWALKNNIKLYRISYDSCYSNNQLNNILSDIIKKEISFEEDSAF